jgi:hypothetical protein
MDAQSLPAGLTIHPLREMVACVERPMTCACRPLVVRDQGASGMLKMRASSFVKHQNLETNDAFHATVHGCRRKDYPVRSRMKIPAAVCSAEVATSATKAGSHGGSWKHPSPRQSSKISRTNRERDGRGFEVRSSRLMKLRPSDFNVGSCFMHHNEQGIK